MAKNKYGVGKKQWKRWPELAQRVFNSTYKYMRGSQWVFLHPDTPEAPKEQWKTVAWNAAWVAADAAWIEMSEINNA